MSRSEFYNTIRPMFGGAMSQKQVDGTEALLAATDGLPITYRAYLMATAKHETASTMMPISEYGRGKGKPYGKHGKHGQAQYGRGYVQLTWDANYEKADKALGLNGALLKDFNLAMQPTIAAQILVRGCCEGWFTGKKLSDYLPDYVQARRVVNGLDKAALIAGYARSFEAAFVAASDHKLDAPPLSPKPVDASKAPQIVINPTEPRHPTPSLFGAVLALLIDWIKNLLKGNRNVG